MNYNSQSMATTDGKLPVGFGDTRMSSFGVGRECMQRIHIDQIVHKHILGKDKIEVGPGSHNLDLKWTKPADSSLSKTTP